jgi:hypothetical protein
VLAAAVVSTLVVSGPVVAGMAGTAAAVTSTIVEAAADAYVQVDSPSTNFGTATTLVARAGSAGKPAVVAYLSFTVSGLVAPPAGVELRLFSYSQSGTGVQLWTAPSTWTETGITWGNAPPPGATPVASIAKLVSNSWAAADVSSAVTGNGTYTFVITTTSGLSKQFASRQVAASRPRLVVNTTAPGVIAAPAGGGQTAPPGGPFNHPLTATVTDGVGTPVAGVPVTFSAPTTGATATFAGGASAVTVTSAADGKATSPVLTAGTTAGNYVVTASVTGVPAPASFALTNGGTSSTSGSPAASATPTGTTTTTTVNVNADAYVTSAAPGTNFGTGYTLFTQASGPQQRAYLRFPVAGLTGTVTSAVLQLYSYSTYAAGVKVFTSPATWTETGLTYDSAPATGAQVGTGTNLVVNTTAAIDVTPAVTGNGTVSLVVTTDRTTANKFAARESSINRPTLVVTTVSGTTTPPASPSPSASPSSSPSTSPTTVPPGSTVTPTGGSGQTAMVGTAFAAPLTATVTDGGAPIAGASVTFTAPATEPSATFPGGAGSVTVTTDTDGVATSPPVTAGRMAGGFAITATAGTATADFALTSRDPMIVTAGDISCAAGSAPTATKCQQLATSDLALSLHPDVALPLGDDQYELGSLSDFTGSYGPSWGRLDSISRPVPGNHEYGYIGTAITPTGGTGYFTYYGVRSHPLQPNCSTLCTPWYSYDIGSWHIVALDSQCGVVGGCNPGNPQYQWLLNDLNSHPAQCTLAYWHIPIHASSTDRQPDMQSIYSLLDNKGADVVLAGHAHYYERFDPQDAAKNPSPTGIRDFVVGTGGRSFFPISATPQPNSVARIANTFGVLQMTLSDGAYSWNFAPTNAGGATDSGTAGCV